MANETDRRHPNVVNLDELDAHERLHGDAFGSRIKMLGAPTGGTQVGCNWFEVPPGRSAFPKHYHCAIEEAVFVLEGSGTLRIGDDELPIRAGDYLTFPAGPDHAHRIHNGGESPLRYLCVSSKAVADVVGYPDSNKLLATASPSASFFDPPWVRGVYKKDATVDYYEGEDE